MWAVSDWHLLCALAPACQPVSPTSSLRWPATSVLAVLTAGATRPWTRCAWTSTRWVLPPAAASCSCFRRACCPGSRHVEQWFGQPPVAPCCKSAHVACPPLRPLHLRCPLRCPAAGQGLHQGAEHGRGHPRGDPPEGGHLREWRGSSGGLCTASYMPRAACCAASAHTHCSSTRWKALSRCAACMLAATLAAGAGAHLRQPADLLQLQRQREEGAAL